jgi:hypothetical protein
MLRPGLSVWQKQLDFPHIGLVHDPALAQGAFPLGGLLRQNVAMVRFVVNHLATPGFFESFGRRPVRLDFWHGFWSP